MFNSTPTDVLVLDADSILLARFARSKDHALTRTARASVSGAFDASAVTPGLADPAKLEEAVRRLRAEAGSLDRAWLLLPDSWFRLNLIELDELPGREDEAREMIRWSIRRTLPIPAEQMRVGWLPLSRENSKKKFLVVSAREETLAAVESTFRKSGVEVAGIEATGLNLWNAVNQREAATTADRLLIHLRDDEFTTGLFRGNEPLFLRSRPLHGDRSVVNEIRLSASYLKESVRVEKVESCFVAGNRVDQGVLDLTQELFGVTPRRVKAAELLGAPLPPGASETEIIAARGVFTQ